jgi:3-phosphoshikimate 1-carboxyvinyltransferase
VKLVVDKTGKLSGAVTAPPSKSHTHRAIIIASLACGTSTIENPLLSGHCIATLDACRKFGAKLEVGKVLRIAGVGGRPKTPRSRIDVRNSGTTIRFMTAVSALCPGVTELTGDASIRARPMGPLLRSLTDLGARGAESLNGNGCPPVAVTGMMKGGHTVVDGFSSQFISGLLVACPLAEADSAIEVRNLNSRPYVRMTLEHLERAGANIRHNQLKKFHMEGAQSYGPVHYTVPGDHSSAAFLLAAAFITDSDIDVLGLDEKDSQGDRTISGIMRKMRSRDRREIDLRDTPDLLPVSAVLGCHAEGTTILKNAQHGRHKESDRISALCAELKKMGADIEERRDGLVVRSGGLRGARLDGHGDHRMVMALAVAALGATGRSIINGAEALSTSYPDFVDDLARLGAKMRMVED